MEERISDLISQMTLEEKASLCSGLDFWHLKGIPRLGVPSIMVADGPHGLRKQPEDVDHLGLGESMPATCFPTASALAATWNRELIYQVGQALGRECLAEKVGVILGPGLNIKRSPLCGRNFEYFSEDPYLTGEIAKSHVSGVQGQGVGTSVKHFVANNQETRRMTIDAVVDERALREIYLAGFEHVVKETQPWTVMHAYNRVNSSYCGEHAELLRGILKGEWGHEGLVVTDWGAMDQRAEALAAGTELEMPGISNGNDGRIVVAVEAGQLAEEVLDDAVERLLALIFKAEAALAGEHTYDPLAHHALARRVAGEAAVLLKNCGQPDPLLPLRAGCKVALIGRFARTPRYQGAGSSLINPSHLDNLYDEMLELAGEENLVYAPGYAAKGDEPDEALIQEAVGAAQGADVAVVCAGLPDVYEIEGLDREHMRLPESHNALIRAVAAANPNLVVVLSNGAPVEMPWAGRVPAILEGYLGGQAGAGALVDILYGLVNPSGKLAETFPLRLEDDLAHRYFPGGPKTVEYRESIYIGYRYYDTAGQEVLYPFGHGLSYTTFAYRDLALDRDEIDAGDNLTVSVKVQNSGGVAGQEIVQLYVRDVESTAFRPDKELKGFAKVALQPGQEEEVTFVLGRRAFAVYDTGLGDWHVEAGNFELLVGASSRDIRLSTTVRVNSTQPPATTPDRDKLAEYYDLAKGAAISREAFEALLGREVSSNEMASGKPYTINTPISDMQGSFVGRQLRSYMQRELTTLVDEADETNALLLQAMAREAPLRLMLMAGDERLSRDMLEGLLLMINGRYLKGVLALVKSWWRSRG
jgi:beta-glucosidase